MGNFSLLIHVSVPFKAPYNSLISSSWPQTRSKRLTCFNTFPLYIIVNRVILGAGLVHWPLLFAYIIKPRPSPDPLGQSKRCLGSMVCEQRDVIAGPTRSVNSPITSSNTLPLCIVNRVILGEALGVPPLPCIRLGPPPLGEKEKTIFLCGQLTNKSSKSKGGEMASNL
jgi:hypothetical protein